jgi:hypothetical protein
MRVKQGTLKRAKNYPILKMRHLKRQSMKKTDKILLASMLQQQRLLYKSHLQKPITYYLEHSQLGLDGKRF